jgi:hypothetical protein
MDADPGMAPTVGNGLTVISVVVDAVPQDEVTV